MEVVRLSDPRPLEQPAPQSQWWPPAILEPSWVDSAVGVDLAHVHFGFDERTPVQLEAFVAALRRRGIPLVYTVHDLRNPHHPDSAFHDAQLDVIVPAADALITLTPGAARQIARRWNRTATVIPHPHVVEFDRMARTPAPSESDQFTIGIHVKSVRANMKPAPVIRTAIEFAAKHPGASVQVNGHTDVLDPAGTRYNAAFAGALRSAQRDGLIDLRVHDYFTDDQLWDYLQGLDVSILPYQFGTHSGWLEACRDLGTTVIAPDCGFYAQQGPVLEYGHSVRGFDADSLLASLEAAYRDRPDLSATVPERSAQRDKIAGLHGVVYRGVL